jgi:hypothetical protein
MRKCVWFRRRAEGEEQEAPESPVPHKGKVMAMEREYYILWSGVVVASFHEEQTRYY